MDKDMTESEKQNGLLFTAELQFRLASAVVWHPRWGLSQSIFL